MRTSRWFVIGQLLVLIGAVVLATQLGRMSAWRQAGLWLTLAGASVFLICARAGISAFGPILFYDLVRSARRGRQPLLRTVYLAALLAMLFLLYVNWFGGGWNSRTAATFPALGNTRDPDFFTPPAANWTSQTLSPAMMAQFTEEFFVTFMKVQFVVLALITPACVAGAIAEEKERQTLDFLLATELKPREIVLGKTVSRLLYLSLVLLTGLPVLGMVQLLGGVDPQMVLQGFAVTGLTVLGLSGVSILMSVLFARPRTAILMTYGAAGIYYLLATVLHGLSDSKELLAKLLNAGNVLSGLDLFDDPLVPRVPPVLGDRAFLWHYALFHVGLALGCVLAALVLLRPLATWQASRKSGRSFRITFLPRRRPRVQNDDPMLWKELHAEPLFRLGRYSMAVVGSLFYGLGILGLIAFAMLFFLGLLTDRLAEVMNLGVRLLGTPLACLTLLGVAVRAATSISAERDRQTLDSLLSSPLRSAAIVRAKWLGSLLSVRRVMYYLLAMWVIGVLTGGLSPLGFALLVVAWLVYAAFLTSLGLTFSLYCKNATRATLWTLGTIIGLCVGPSLFGMCVNPLLFTDEFTRTRYPTLSGQRQLIGLEPNAPSASEILLRNLHTFGLTPPVAINLLSFSNKQFVRANSKGWVGEGNHPYYEYDNEVFEPMATVGRLAAVQIGLGFFGGAAFILGSVSWFQFAAKTGRMPQATRVLGVGNRLHPKPLRSDPVTRSDGPPGTTS